MDQFDQNARLTALQRRYGASPVAVDIMRAMDRQSTDWYTVCRKCGAKIEGSVSQIKEHSCG